MEGLSYDELIDVLYELNQETSNLEKQIFLKNEPLISEAILYLQENRRLLDKITSNIWIEIRNHEESSEILFYVNESVVYFNRDDIMCFTIKSEEDLRKARIIRESITISCDITQEKAILKVMQFLEDNLREIAKQNYTDEMISLINNYNKVHYETCDILDELATFDEYWR